VSFGQLRLNKTLLKHSKRLGVRLTEAANMLDERAKRKNEATSQPSLAPG